MGITEQLRRVEGEGYGRVRGWNLKIEGYHRKSDQEKLQVKSRRVAYNEFYPNDSENFTGMHGGIRVQVMDSPRLLTLSL